MSIKLRKIFVAVRTLLVHFWLALASEVFGQEGEGRSLGSRTYSSGSSTNPVKFPEYGNFSRNVGERSLGLAGITHAQDFSPTKPRGEGDFFEVSPLAKNRVPYFRSWHDPLSEKRKSYLISCPPKCHSRKQGPPALFSCDQS